MFTAQELAVVVEKHFARIDTRFLTGVEHDGVVDLELDDAILRVSMNQKVVKTFTITLRQIQSAKEDRAILFDTYAAPAIVEFINELRMKAKRVVVCVQPVERRDPDRIKVMGSENGPRLSVSSLESRDGAITFTMEMRFGTFNI